MYVKDLRKIIKEYSRKDLEQLVVELYKQIPKAKREDHQTDELIHNLKEGKVVKKKAIEKPSIDQLKTEILDFIDLAKEQYYVKPNTIVPKKQRSNWRFVVINFIKQLDLYTSSDSGYAIATELYFDLYEILSQATNYWVFVSDEPFSAINISQSEFIEKICARLFHATYHEKDIEKVLTLILENPTDYMILSSQLLKALLKYLPTNPVKESALKIVDRLIKEKQTSFNGASKFSNEYYHLEGNLKNLVSFSLEVQINLNQIDEGIQYFQKYYPGKDREITLYVLLGILENHELYEPYITTYEAASKRNINPRENLKSKYHFYKKNGKIDSSAYFKEHY